MPQPPIDADLLRLIHEVASVPIPADLDDDDAWAEHFRRKAHALDAIFRATDPDNGSVAADILHDLNDRPLGYRTSETS